MLSEKITEEIMSSDRHEKKVHETTLGTQFRRRWQAPIDANLAHIPILFCCVCTGLLDTVMFQGKQIR